MNRKAKIKRKIVEKARYRHFKEETVELTLECGHKKRYKVNDAPGGWYAFCEQCEPIDKPTLKEV